MSLLDRTQRALRAFRKSGPDMELLQKQLDTIVQNDLAVEKAAKTDTDSQLDIRRTTNNLAYFSMFRTLKSWVYRGTDKIPPYGTYERDLFMAEFWMEEPILAGAIYSLTAKIAALGWTVSGKRNLTANTARMLAQAAHIDGYDWGGFISSSALDYYTLNNGVFWETAKQGDPMVGRMIELGHIDSLACTLTGNKLKPMIYASEVTGQILEFGPGEYIHFASLPSPRELYLANGFCFANRAYRAAKLLMGLHDYDDEKLANLPPEGVASVTGLTMEEFTDAVQIYLAQRERDSSLTFPQVLWLISSQPNAQVSVQFTGFSQIPESFDRKTVIDQYVSILALAAGVDAREFWAISSGALGTASESEIQHMKAKGKGTGEIISTIERHINGELPEGVDFGFDTQDIEEDANAAAVAKAWIDAYFTLYNLTPVEDKEKAEEVQKQNPRPDKPDGSPTLPTTPVSGVDTGDNMTNSGKQGNQYTGGGFGAPATSKPEQVITKDEFIQLLIEKGVLPEWLQNSKRITIRDADIHINKDLNGDDVTRFQYKNGVLKELGMPAINLYSTPKQNTKRDVTVAEQSEDELMYAYLQDYKKEIIERKRNIIGSPIPEREALRGVRVTRATIRDEIERWRQSPVLAPYAPTDEELDEIYGTLRAS